jgi:hypothetical protein
LPGWLALSGSTVQCTQRSSNCALIKALAPSMRAVVVVLSVMSLVLLVIPFHYLVMHLPTIRPDKQIPIIRSGSVRRHSRIHRGTALCGKLWRASKAL